MSSSKRKNKKRGCSLISIDVGDSNGSSKRVSCFGTGSEEVPFELLSDDDEECDEVSSAALEVRKAAAPKQKREEEGSQKTKIASGSEEAPFELLSDDDEEHTDEAVALVVEGLKAAVPKEEVKEEGSQKAKSASATAAAGSATRTIDNALDADSTITASFAAISSPKKESNYDSSTASKRSKKANGAVKRESPSVTSVPIQKEKGAASSPAPTTIINGQGIWRSWSRNFSSPLLAFLDILDNALDANTTTTPPSRSSISAITDNTTGRITIDADGNNGLVLMNSCTDPIPPLRHVLEVYTTCKQNNSIGENGVGLKQGCATLSDLNFCLTKNNGVYSLGILAYELQTEKACYLPSFTLNNAKDLEKQLTQIFKPKIDPGICKCVARYGGGMGTYEYFIQKGIDRLLKHFSNMNRNGWERYNHVFTVVLCELKHQASATEQQHVDKFLDALYNDIPIRYLHVPDSLQVKVQGRTVQFNHWQSRLVELSKFQVQINKLIPLTQDDSWKTTQDKKSKNRKGNIVYPLTLYLGFDAVRLMDHSLPNKTAAMYIYSRKSGRLIQHHLDCRGILGITTGGSKYCQGLTVLLDDVHGNLPLNPNKQDLSFGEKVNGETHQQNLYMWTSAVIRAYYSYFLDHIFQGQKHKLSDSIGAAIQSQQHIFPTLSQCQLNTFSDFTTDTVVDHRIRLRASRLVVRKIGNDTKFLLSKRAPLPKQRKTPTDRSRTNPVTTPQLQNSSLSTREKDKDLSSTFAPDTPLVARRDCNHQQPASQGTSTAQLPFEPSITNRDTPRRAAAIQSCRAMQNHPNYAELDKYAEETKYEYRQAGQKRKRSEDGCTGESSSNDDDNDADDYSENGLAHQHQVHEQRIHEINEEIADFQRQKFTLEKQVKNNQSTIDNLEQQLAHAIQQQQQQNQKVQHRHQQIEAAMDTSDELHLFRNYQNMNSILNTENNDLRKQLRELEGLSQNRDQTIAVQRALLQEQVDEASAVMIETVKVKHAASDFEDCDEI